MSISTLNSHMWLVATILGGVGMEHFQLYANVSIVNKIHIHLEGLLSLQQFLSLCTLFQVVLKRVSLYLKRLVNTRLAYFAHCLDLTSSVLIIL